MSYYEDGGNKKGSWPPAGSVTEDGKARIEWTQPPLNSKKDRPFEVRWKYTGAFDIGKGGQLRAAGIVFTNNKLCT